METTAATLKILNKSHKISEADLPYTKPQERAVTATVKSYLNK